MAVLKTESHRDICNELLSHTVFFVRRKRPCHDSIDCIFVKKLAAGIYNSAPLNFTIGSDKNPNDNVAFYACADGDWLVNRFHLFCYMRHGLAGIDVMSLETIGYGQRS